MAELTKRLLYEKDKEDISDEIDELLCDIQSQIYTLNSDLMTATIEFGRLIELFNQLNNISQTLEKMHGEE